ncbi:MAG: Ig-like domain-containing protein, partial [Flammeovirgaceae bacterium]|nr:Ig-like domain-containing protein [Flammeovirgaceae bacterium]
TPLNGATGVIETNDITISFNETIRRASDDANLDNTNIDGSITLKLTDATGANIAFDATINGSDDVVTINPTATLPGNTVIYVAIAGVEDGSDNLISPNPASITFTTGDTQPPSATFNPANSATNFSAVGNITITLNEPIRNIDDSAITPADIEGGLVELKLTNNAGAAVPFTATIDGTNTLITINPNSTLTFNQVYYVELNPVEDVNDNASSSQNITFTTENRPSITGFTAGPDNNTTGTCISDTVVVNGLRFEGTGNPISGNAEPTVTINGVAVPSGNIISHNATQVVFKMPIGATTGPITVKNNDSDLTSANSGSDLSVFPAIDTTLPVTIETVSPAQNTNVDVTIDPTQNGFDYALILISAPASFIAEHSLTLPDAAHIATGDGTDLILNTSEGTDPDFTKIGSYDYIVEVRHSGCTSINLDASPYPPSGPTFTLTVASLAVTASATDTTICLGSSTTLIGATSGGTGFYQFSWTSSPAGFTDSNSSPTDNPTVNTRYYLTLTDNSGNTATDSVDIVVNPVPTADIIPAPGETVVRTNYTIENFNYQLYGSPAGGIFSGQGVSLISGNYYFNPQSATVGDWTITYTYTNGFGCSNSDSEIFKVTNSAVNNLDLSYCKNITSDGPLSYIPANFPPTYQYTRLVFYSYNSLTGICLGEPAPTFTYCGGPNPLTPLAFENVADIQAGVTLPVGTMLNRPTAYSLNLDVIRSNYGYTNSAVNPYSFYILVYGKDANGNETYLTYQYFTVLDNGPAPTIVGINENENVCSDVLPITLTSSEPGYTITDFEIIQAAHNGALSGTNDEEFDPDYTSLMSSGQYETSLTITMNYSDYNNCTGTVFRNFLWVKKPDAPIAPNVDYCQSTDGIARQFTIDATRNGPATNPYWYELDPTINPTAPVLDSVNFKGFVAPGITGLSAIAKTFYVTQNNKGCEGAVTPVQIEIKAAPNASFILPPICDDRNFTITGPQDTGPTPYIQYDWVFGNGTDSTVTNNNQITYNYGPGTANNSFTIGLTVTNSDGCLNNSASSATVGQNPNPIFNYNFVCNGDSTLFNASSPNVPATQFRWNFGDSVIIPKDTANDAAPEGGTVQNPYHTFSSGVGNYNVTVTAFTNIGCSDSITNTVTILDYVTHTTSFPYDMGGVDGGMGYWRLQDIAGNSTWQFVQPTDTVMSKFSTQAWVTNGLGNYVPDEISFINSPCFDISNIIRPVISLDYIMELDKGRDGVALEWSKDGGLNWFPLGGIGSGSNWFNTIGFTGGNIGSSPIGWSGNSWEDLEQNPQKDSLVEGRRALDNIGTLTQMDRAKVRFRIAFESNGDGEFEGFGFNNVKIETRNRTLLIENFTNENDTQHPANAANFNSQSALESVKIQYHMSFGGSDVINSANPTEVAARAAYYGIAYADQYIPRVYLDGESNGDMVNLGTWFTPTFDDHALVTSPFTISITTTSITPGELQISATVTAIRNFSAASTPILHIVGVEKTVGSNEFVFRKMLPSAVGTQLPKTFQNGAFQTVSATWVIDANSNIDPSDLAVVALVQDEVFKGVYQAAVELNPVNPGTITGNEDPAYASKILVYPNPANKELTITLPDVPQQAVPLRLFDGFGKEAVNNTIGAGENSKTIDTRELAQGVYLLQIQTKQGLINRKVIIAR